MKSTQWYFELIDPTTLQVVKVTVSFEQPVDCETASRFIECFGRPDDIDDADWWKKGKPEQPKGEDDGDTAECVD